MVSILLLKNLRGMKADFRLLRTVTHWIVILVCCGPLTAQSLTDTGAAKSLLYTGTEYTKQYSIDAGSPFFEVNNLAGRVRYWGNWYPVPELYYDCEEDGLLMPLPSHQYFVWLVREKVEAFELDRHFFVKLNLNSGREEFVEQIYSGKRKVYVKWQKRLIKNMQEIGKYQVFRTLFILQENAVHYINQLSDLYELLGPRAKEMKSYYRKQRLTFRKEPLKALSQIIQEAESRGW